MEGSRAEIFTETRNLLDQFYTNETNNHSLFKVGEACSY